MRSPVVQWTVLLAAGIVGHHIVKFSVAAWLLIVASSGVLSGLFARRGGVYGITVALVIVSAGGWWHAHRQAVLADGLDAYIETGPVLMQGVVNELPEIAADRAYYVLGVTAIDPGSQIDGSVRAAQSERVSAAAAVAGSAAGMPIAPQSVQANIRVTVMGPARFQYGDVLHVRAVLRRPDPATNPGAFDYRAYLERHGITAIAFVQYPRHAVYVGRQRLNPFMHWAAAVREAVQRGLFAALPTKTAQLLAGIALGDRRNLPGTVEDDFRRAGISHLLAVSGMHVGFVAAAAGALLRVLRIPRRYAVLIATGLVWTYVLATGARPPAVRAGVASTFGLAAFGIGRTSDGAAALALAGLVLLVQNPLLLFDVSFQLSFVATAAIIIGFTPLQRRLGVWPRPLATLTALAVTAQVGVMPLLARTFYEVSTVGLFAGLLAAPLVALLVPLGIGTALFHNVWAWGSRGPAFVVHWLTQLLTGISRFFAALPWSYVTVPRPPWAFIGAVWVFAFTLARGANWSPRRRRQAYGLCAFLMLWSVGSGLFGRPTGLQLIAIDVGQGDALFIRTPAGATALVDGGGQFQTDADNASNTGTDIIIPYLRYTGLRRVDVVVNTHPHEDHLQGLLPVLTEYDVQLAVDSGQNSASPSWQSYLQLIEEEAIVRHVAAPGDVIWLDEQTRLEVLHPQLPLMEGTRSDLNNNSIVLRLVYGDTSALLTGDIETEAQLLLLRSGAPLPADVVKVPHHGSRLALVTSFYEAVGAGVAFIPVGRNNYGHPSPEVVATLHELGMAVYRTDVHGAVKIVSDGSRWTVRTMQSGR